MLQKRIMPIALLLILILSLFAGCGSPEEEGSQEVQAAATFKGFTSDIPENIKPLLSSNSIFLNYTAECTGKVPFQLGYTIIDNRVREDHIIAVHDAVAGEETGYSVQQSYLITPNPSTGMIEVKAAQIGDSGQNTSGQHMVKKAGLTAWSPFIKESDVTLHDGEEIVLAGFVGSTDGIIPAPPGVFFDKYATIDEALAAPEMTDPRYANCYYIVFYATALPTAASLEGGV